MKRKNAHRDRLHRALDRVIDSSRAKKAKDAIGEDISPEILNKLKAMETNSRNIGNAAEANAFLEKVRQYEPRYQAGSHNYEEVSPRTQALRARHAAPGQQANRSAYGGGSNRGSAHSVWEEMMKRRRDRETRKEQATQARREERKRTQTATASGSTQHEERKAAQSAGGGRSAAAKKAWETMRAKKASASAR